MLEKDESLLFTLGEFLETEGHKVYQTRDVSGALQVLNKEKIDLFLLDTHTTDFSMLIKIINGKLNGTKVILISTQVEEKYKNLKYDSFLIKPFNISNLLDLIKH